MKNFFKSNKYHIFMATILTIGFLLLFVCSNFNFHIIAKATNHESQQLYDTSFIYSPKSAIKCNDYILVLDDKSNSIIKLKDGEIIQGENATISSYNATHMYKLGDKIILLSLTTNLSNKLITILNANDFTVEEAIYDATSSGIMSETYDNVSIYANGNSLYVLLYKLNQYNGVESMLYFTVTTEADNKARVSAMRNLSINSSIAENNFSENISSINLLFDSEKQLPVCLVHSNSEVFAIYIENESDEISALFATNISTNELTTAKSFTIVSISDNPYIIFEKENNLEVHGLHIPVTNIGDDKFSVDGSFLNIDISLESIESMQITNNNLILCSKTNQEVVSITINSDNGMLSSYNKEVYKNPTVTTHLYESKDIVISEIVSDTSVSLLSSPYSTNSSISLTPHTNVVEIGFGAISYTNSEPAPVSNTISISNAIIGYKYFMVNVNGTNKYGYLPISAVSEIETPDASYPYAFAKKNVNVYKYPSATIDDNNTIIYTTQEVERLSLLRNIEEYSYTVGTENSIRTFYEVEIDGTVGYILSTDIDRFPEVVLVQTNAIVTRTTVVYQSTLDEVPTWQLLEGKRVRILENRFGTEKWSKIAFNDDDGVTCIGYIHADSIQADSWSTLQIIGLILVVISLVLLAIILIVRSRVNHE